MNGLEELGLAVLAVAVLSGVALYLVIRFFKTLDDDRYGPPHDGWS